MRDGVIVAVDLDVVVDVDARLAPVGVDEALAPAAAAAPADRTARRASRREAPAVALHRPGIESREQLGDPGVQRGQGEEGLVPQPRENPAFGDLHGDFDLRFVAGFRRARRDDAVP